MITRIFDTKYTNEIMYFLISVIRVKNSCFSLQLNNLSNLLICPKPDL